MHGAVWAVAVFCAVVFGGRICCEAFFWCRWYTFEPSLVLAVVWWSAWCSLGSGWAGGRGCSAASVRARRPLRQLLHPSPIQKNTSSEQKLKVRKRFEKSVRSGRSEGKDQRVKIYSRLSVVHKQNQGPVKESKAILRTSILTWATSHMF